uniref:glycosyltransferase n=1 Tax=Flavobacterium sp. TaxID=239 RepID=UPI004047E319
MSDDFNIIIAGDNVTTYSKTYPNINFINVPINRKLNLLIDIFALFKLIFIILRYKPDICHSIMPKAALLSAVASWPFISVRVHTFTGQVWQSQKGLKRLILKEIDKFIIKLNTICFTDSQSQSQFLLSEGISLKGNPLPIISKGSLGGVDLNKISINKKNYWRKKIRYDYKIDEKSIVIGYLARKTLDKGAILLLNAFRKIRGETPNVILMFIGPDESNGILDLYKSEHIDWNHKVIDIGKVVNHEEYLSAIDVLCLPSYREGFGSIVIDAAALAIPTIGSRIPGLVDAIEDFVTGRLFNCGDIDDLCKQLQIMLNDKCLLQTYGTNAYARVVKFYDSKVITKNLEDS